jgi:HAD superfamily hydrolase (TIGR01509 family)
VHTDKVYYKVWEKILKNYNIQLSDDIYKKFIYSNTDNYVKNTLLKNIDISIENIMEKKDTYFKEFSLDIELVNGAIEFVNRIKFLGHKICIVTNSNRETAEFVIRFIGINDIIDYLVIGSECERAKPYPDPYLKAMKYFDVCSEKCFIFEDSHNGILSAKTSNPKCIVGIGENNTELIACGADLVYKDYSIISINDIYDLKRDNTSIYKKYIKNSIEKYHTGINNIHINPIKLKGGFIADVYPVEFTYNDQVHSAIFKVENNNETILNKISHELDLYNRENYFYESISAHIPICTPKFYGLIRDDNYKVIGILIEDLRKEGFYLDLDLNKEQVNVSLSIIDHMAKMHASCWGKEINNQFVQLKKNNDKCFQPKLENFIQGRIKKFIQKWEHMLDIKSVKFFEDIALNFNNIF